MSELSIRLDRLGAALEAAVAADLRRARRPRRRLVVAALAAAIAIPTAGFAADRLISNHDVAQSLPVGIYELAGMTPTCTTVTQNVEYHCVVDREPSHASGVMKGSVYQTVDASHHVNGGCRALNTAATEWECYIGQAAVDQKIISADFLGEEELTPSIG
ncbi:MAG: hypothetical protein ACJ76I_01845 [Gaiellaceae bacterium]